MNPYITEETARRAEVIGWGLETTAGQTTVFPYFTSGDVTGGDNFWPTQGGAQAVADSLNTPQSSDNHAHSEGEK